MTTHVQTDVIYTPEELRAMISKMTKASNAFYAAAIQIGAHAFIEFTGLMNEYIKVCAEALARGEDFTLANTHTGKPLPMYPHEAAYLAEKLQCIFSWSPEASNAVVVAIMEGQMSVNEPLPARPKGD
jgi:hypothetical protein